MTPWYLLSEHGRISVIAGRSGTWFDPEEMNIRDVKETFRYGFGVQWYGLG